MFSVHSCCSDHVAHTLVCDCGYRKRGATAVLAMLFLMLITALTVGMFSIAQTNVQSSTNLSEVTRALSAAESGMNWIQWRFVSMNRPKTTAGVISQEVAQSIWPALRSAIVDDFNSLSDPSERPSAVTSTSVTSSLISLSDGQKFFIHIEQDTSDPRWLNVTSTGQYGSAERSVSMRFKIDKKIRFAVVGKVPIQLGRNTIIEGPVAMGTPGKYPPILMLSDFEHLNPSLTSRINNWQALLESQNVNYSGFISVNDTERYQQALSAGFNDYDRNGVLDELDIFIQHYDTNGDRAVSSSEFTDPSTGKLYDPNLFAAIDSLGGPLFVGDVERLGLNDGQIDLNDSYAKIRGQIILMTSASAWQNNLGSTKTIHDMIVGPVVPPGPGVPAVKFSAAPNDIIDLSPANFEEAAQKLRLRSGSYAGIMTKTSSLIANTTLSASDANGGTAQERTPYGSVSYQATYRRPVFRNMTLRNVVIPKGLNALFENCTFEGVTFVEGERDIKTSSESITYNKDDGMSWAQRRIKGDSFTKDKVLLSSGTPSSGQTITYGSQNGNNLRFHNCTFKGPVAGNYSTAYTHFANSWEFTGATLFDNQVDQTVTILSPQVNIEMGSFTNPDAAPSTLIGVVVAGNIDIRGTSIVDGSIIVTGDGAGNTTLGYFGASDSDTNPSALPEGGYGRLSIRYNPNRALPDGINVAIDITPDPTTYSEGLP